jgi:hypothetical protein
MIFTYFSFWQYNLMHTSRVLPAYNASMKGHQSVVYRRRTNADNHKKERRMKPWVAVDFKH